MSDFLLIPEKTCCFSGHRVLEGFCHHSEFKRALYTAFDRGCDTFLCGMALGFDSYVFDVLLDFKINSSYPVKIVACLPCKDQDKFFNDIQKKDYKRRLEKADKIIYVSERNYFNGCMQKRNRFMVDNSSFLICYLKKNEGGTFSTVDYARKKGLEIINVLGYLDKEKFD